jgi:hypothetical protein
MLLRAVFWIGLVALMMPHEPDLGLGRPDSAVALISRNLPAVQQIASPANVCKGHEQACGGALSVVDWFQQNAVRSLATVKTEIEEQQRERGHHAD